MPRTQEATTAPNATTPATAAPILVGYDGSEGGRDALELSDERDPRTRSLFDEAREGAATVVVGGPHLSALGRALLGSVAERVLHHADREVAIAPHGYSAKRHETFAKIAVAFDGTAEAKTALVRAEAEVPPEHPRNAPEVPEQALANVDPVLSPSGRCLAAGWRGAS